MLNRTAILWIVYAAIIGFVGGASLFSPQTPPAQQHAVSSSNKATKPNGANLTSPKSADDRIADSTWWVAAFTCALVVISAVQINFLLRADQTARISADAAKRSADAAIGVELPILVPSMIALFREPGVHGKVVGYPGPISIFKINFKNFGRSSAELVSQCIEWTVVEKLPEIPVYKSNFPFIPGTFVEHGHNLPATVQNFIISLQPDEIEAISKETKFLWVYGYLSFKDFLGSNHDQRWCAKWQAFGDNPDGTRTSLGFVYDSTTPAEYTKRS
jgi:hypothetical protein